MSGIGLALSAASAFMQFRQGQAQAAMLEGQARSLEVQAEYTRFNAKGESLKYKKQAADQLENTLVRMAQINAAAGAGHMDPFSGNPFGLKIRALDVGGTNFAMAGLNETITRLTGESQAQMQLVQASRARAASKTARSSGMMGAMMTLASGAFDYARTSIPGSTAPLAPITPPPPTSGGGFGMNLPGSMGAAPPGAYFGTGPNYQMIGNRIII
tara:strand:- start:78 stop:719 length:642 start_codon:yes stop_codon:yes gene_type:complete